jgi:hypothetical protein
VFSYFLNKLRSTAEGNGTLLDHSIVLYGSSLSDSNKHIPANLPILLAGGGSGQLKGGRHVLYPKEKEIPFSNLLITILDKIGVNVEKFADSTGELAPLTV